MITGDRTLNNAAVALEDENRVLRQLLREARQYVSDAGSDEDPETVTNAQVLCIKIDTALSSTQEREP